MRKEQALREETRLLQEGYSKKDIAKQTVKGAALGATVLPAALGAGVMVYDDGLSAANIAAGALAGLDQTYDKKYRGIAPAVFAGTGAALNVARNYALMMWQVKKISDALSRHTNFEFKSLPIEQAMLVVAAYKRNVPLLKSVAEIQAEFMNEKGVWKVVTELFYNQRPTKSRVRELQRMIQED